MNEKGFRAFLTESDRVPKNLSHEAVLFNIEAVRDFEEYLKGRSVERSVEEAGEEDVDGYVRFLADKRQATEERLIALFRYARFAANRKVEIAILKLLDGVSVLDQLSETTRHLLGDSKHKAVLDGIELPKLGDSSESWHVITSKFMNQLEANVDQATCEEILLTGPHAGPPEWYEEERQAYLRSKNIDEFLRTRHEMAVETLTKHMEENTLFFNQEIDQDVVDFVRSNQEIMGGIRKGEIIYETKIPYMAREYLREKDETMRRYYYCHCPWVREAIRTGHRISPTFCYCSAGYHKKPWEVILGKPLKAEVLSSVLKGDDLCRFAIRIPKLASVNP
ncbi:MAG: hypothetical protein JSU93_01055 [Methanobacteriota archaeon]|nr:MAG: hypothetical protein JSU93_01055 [Euryarchaeota archaeon]